MLGEVAWIISRMQDKYLSAQYQRMARLRGKQKAIVAVSHSILVIISHVLRDKKPYTDLGADYFDKLDTAADCQLQQDQAHCARAHNQEAIARLGIEAVHAMNRTGDRFDQVTY